MKRKNYFGKASAVLALALSVLISGCSENEAVDNLGDTSDSGQTAITAELPVTAPETKTEAAQTTAAEEATKAVSDTETGEPTGTTALDTKPADTTAKPADTTKPAQTTAATKPAQTTAATKPAQTTVTTPKPAQTTVATKPAQTTVITTAPPQTTVTAAPPPVSQTGESLLENYTKKWWYNHLTADQQAVYRRLFETLSKGSGKCNIYDLNVTVDDLNAAFSAIAKEEPQFLSLVFEYTYNYYTINSRNVVSEVDITLYTSNPQTAKVQQTVKEIIAGANKYSTDYDKIKYVHDYIAETTDYDLNGGEYIHSAEGALVYRRAVCDGYAKAFMYIMQEMGIPCICVEGYANGDHTWNMVQLGGNWYHMDVTWDDPITSDGSNAIRYNYFLVSDSSIKKTHSLTAGFANPTAPANYN